MSSTLETRGALLTLQDVADRWKCSCRTVRRKIRDGSLRAVYLGDRMIRIRTADIDRYEEASARMEGSAAEARPAR